MPDGAWHGGSGCQGSLSWRVGRRSWSALVSSQSVSNPYESSFSVRAFSVTVRVT